MDMDSIPPATTALTSPARTACAASITALSPDPQTLLMVMAGTVAGIPAPMAAWRAGACPSAATTTLPMMTSSIVLTSMPERSTAARMATAPNSGADRGPRPPRKRPMGVRAPSTITGILALSLMKAQLVQESHIFGRLPDSTVIYRHPATRRSRVEGTSLESGERRRRPGEPDPEVTRPRRDSGRGDRAAGPVAAATADDACEGTTSETRGRSHPASQPHR